MKNFFKKGKDSNKKDIEDYSDLSLDELKDIEIETLNLEDLSLDDMNLDEVLLQDQKEMKSGSSEVNDFEIKNATNKRREHLTAKEDFLQRKKEDAKSRANRKLVNGLIAIFLFVGLCLGSYMVFTDDILNMMDVASKKVSTTWGGLYNKDVKGKVNKDLASVGLSTNKSVEENLSKENLSKIKNSGVEFVKDLPKELKKGSDFEQLKTGNYIIGEDIPENIYYGKGTELIIYDSIKDMKSGKKGENVVLEDDFVKLSKGHLVTIVKKGEFIPYTERKTNIIPLDKLKNDKKYQVGKDVKADTYTMSPVEKKGTVRLISEYNMVDEISVIGSTKVDISKDTAFVEFVDIESIKEIK